MVELIYIIVIKNGIYLLKIKKEEKMFDNNSKVENRGHLVRYGREDILKILSKKHGEKFGCYREAWKNAELKQIVADNPLYIELGIIQ